MPSRRSRPPPSSRPVRRCPRSFRPRAKARPPRPRPPPDPPGPLREFPILLVGVSRVGIVTSERLRRSRRVAVLGIAVFAAAVTPGGDLVSPAILGLALYPLFAGTIVVIRRSG